MLMKQALISDTPEGLQKALDPLLVYCKKWKLKLNETKTKVLIFSTRLSKKTLEN